MLTRREFLRVGTTGALLLATVRFGRTQPSGPAGGTESRPALDTGARDVLAAIVPVFLAGALPADRTARSERISATVDGVDRAIAGLPPHARADLGDLFTLLAFAPSRGLLTGVWRPWRAASVEQVVAFLQDWRASSWALKQQAYLALHELVFGAFYADPANWTAIGYPGPPRLD